MLDSGRVKALTETNLPGLPPPRRGKVRDVYDLGDSLLIIATDRLSAFDVVLSPGIPDKGKILNQLSNYWFSQFPEIENHLQETDTARFPAELAPAREMLAGRAVVAKKCSVIPFECVARGYLAGSGWKDYQKTGAVCGITLPSGLREADKLPEPIFTPATKAESGHDENISFEVMASAIGRELAERLRALTLDIYRQIFRRCAEKGVLLADGKIEFGQREGRLIWIDEAYTPDSSRFWPASAYRPGISPPSYDKQFVRDWLESAGWNKRPPAPELPEQVVQVTREKYLQAFRTLTGTDPSL